LRKDAPSWINVDRGEIMNIYLQAVGFWLGLAILTVLLGALREAVLKPRLGSLRAHQLGTVVTCIILFLLIMWFVRAVNAISVQALTIGVMWLVLTIGFETILGYYVLRQSWDVVLADYNISQGRVWPFVLLTVLLGPYLATQLVA
jgi:FtsH-binding integral membrane protein